MLPNISKKTAVLYFIAVFFISLDRFLKTLFFLNPDKIIDILPFFRLAYAENRYISFSLPLNPTFIKYTVLFLIICLLIIYVKEIGKRVSLYATPLFFLILGAFSNLFDRFKHGFVVDYLDLDYFTVFNIADSMIFCSILAILFLEFRIGIDKNRTS